MAQRIMDLDEDDDIENYQDLLDFSYDISCSDGFGYGLFDGGYIHPSDIYEDNEALEELQEAILLVAKYKEDWEQLSSEY